ncbi:hypothetical protein DIPPA_09715 [Diplonema papillatum]|nr:hypothetical protein DIPPA_09715 [Diplonema papillatum]
MAQAWQGLKRPGSPATSYSSTSRGYTSNSARELEYKSPTRDRYRPISNLEATASAVDSFRRSFQSNYERPGQRRTSSLGVSSAQNGHHASSAAKPIAPPGPPHSSAGQQQQQQQQPSSAHRDRMLPPAVSPRVSYRPSLSGLTTASARPQPRLDSPSSAARLASTSHRATTPPASRGHSAVTLENSSRLQNAYDSSRRDFRNGGVGSATTRESVSLRDIGGVAHWSADRRQHQSRALALEAEIDQAKEAQARMMDKTPKTSAAAELRETRFETPPTRWNSRQAPTTKLASVYNNSTGRNPETFHAGESSVAADPSQRDTREPPPRADQLTISRLRGDVSALQQQLNASNDQVGRLQRELATATVSREPAEAALTRQSSDLQAIETRLHKETSDNCRLQRRNSALAADIDAKDARIEALATELTQKRGVGSACEDLAARLEREQTRVKELEADVKKKGGDVGSRDLALRDLENRLLAEQRKVGEGESRALQLLRESKAKDAKIESLEKDLRTQRDQKQSEINQLKGELINQEMRITALQSRGAETEQAIAQLKDAQAASIAEKNDRLQEHDQKLRDAETKLKEQHRKLNDLQLALSAAEAEAAGQQGLAERYSAEITALREESNTRATAVQNLETALSEAHGVIADEVRHRKTAESRGEAVARELKASLAAADVTVARLCEERQALSDAAEASTARLAELTERLRRADEAAEQGKAEISQELSNERTRHEAAMEVERRHVQVLEADAAEKTDEIAQLSKLAATAETDRAALRDTTERAAELEAKLLYCQQKLKSLEDFEAESLGIRAECDTLRERVACLEQADEVTLSLKTELNTALEAVESQAGALADAQAILGEKCKTVDLLEQDSVAKQDTINSLQAEIETLRQSADEYAARTAQLKADNERLQGAILLSEREVRAQKTELLTQAGGAAPVNAPLGEAAAAVEQLQDALAESRRSEAGLRLQLSALDASAPDAPAALLETERARVQELVQEAEAREATVRDLRQQLDASRRDAERGRAALEKEAADLRREVRRAHDSCSSLESERSQLLMQVQAAENSIHAGKASLEQKLEELQETMQKRSLEDSLKQERERETQLEADEAEIMYLALRAESAETEARLYEEASALEEKMQHAQAACERATAELVETTEALAFVEKELFEAQRSNVGEAARALDMEKRWMSAERKLAVAEARWEVHAGESHNKAPGAPGSKGGSDFPGRYTTRHGDVSGHVPLGSPLFMPAFDDSDLCTDPAIPFSLLQEDSGATPYRTHRSLTRTPSPEENDAPQVGPTASTTSLSRAHDVFFTSPGTGLDVLCGDGSFHALSLLRKAGV